MEHQERGVGLMFIILVLVVGAVSFFAGLSVAERSADLELVNQCVDLFNKRCPAQDGQTMYNITSINEMLYGKNATD